MWREQINLAVLYGCKSRGILTVSVRPTLLTLKYDSEAEAQYLATLQPSIVAHKIICLKVTTNSPPLPHSSMFMPPLLCKQTEYFVTTENTGAQNQYAMPHTHTQYFLLNWKDWDADFRTRSEQWPTFQTQSVGSRMHILYLQWIITRNAEKCS
jgi:hypothetical protein